MTENSKVIKVELTYNDGEVRTLNDRDAEDWMEFINNRCQKGAGETAVFNWRVTATPDKSAKKGKSKAGKDGR